MIAIILYVTKKNMFNQYCDKTGLSISLYLVQVIKKGDFITNFELEIVEHCA